MKILIDLQPVQTDSCFRGVGRYSLNFVKSFATLCKKKHELHILLSAHFLNETNYVRLELLNYIEQSNIHTWKGIQPIHPFHSDNRFRIEAAEILREHVIHTVRPDIVIISGLLDSMSEGCAFSIDRFDNSCPTVVFLYDLIPMENQEIPPMSFPWFNKAYLNRIKHLERASSIFCISETTKDIALEYLNYPKEHIYVVGAAADPLYEIEDREINNFIFIEKKFKLKSKKYILTSSINDERKNISTLIKSYSLLEIDIRKDYPLVLAGRVSDDLRNDYISLIGKSDIDISNVIFTNHVTDEELKCLYSQCALFVFPSINEGFGLPVLEAIMCGAPTIASNIKSIREILDSPEYLFDPLDANQICQMITKIIQRTPEVYPDINVIKKTAQKKHNWSLIAAKTTEYLEKMDLISYKLPSSLNIKNEYLKKIKKIYRTAASDQDYAQFIEVAEINEFFDQSNYLLYCKQTPLDNMILQFDQNITKCITANPSKLFKLRLLDDFHVAAEKFDDYPCLAMHSHVGPNVMLFMSFNPEEPIDFIKKIDSIKPYLRSKKIKIFLLICSSVLELNNNKLERLIAVFDPIYFDLKSIKLLFENKTAAEIFLKSYENISSFIYEYDIYVAWLNLDTILKDYPLPSEAYIVGGEYFKLLIETANWRSNQILQNHFMGYKGCVSTIKKNIFCISANEPVKFNSDNLIYYNWCKPEDTHIWSSDVRSTIGFELPCESIKFKGSIYLEVMINGNQNIELYLNSHRIYSSTLKSTDQTLFIRFDPKYYQLGLNLLRFELPNARAPGGEDTRLISIAIKSITIN